MGDGVALNGRSTCDERTCDRNTRESFLNRAQARLAPKPPVFESRRMCERSRKRTSLMITHIDQTTYQTIHFVGSPQVSFPMCTLEIPQKLQYKFFCS